MKNRNETVGAILAEKRASFGKEIEDITKQTGLSEEFINNVEEHRYDVLAHDIYTVHGIRKYARALGLDGETIKDQYLRERGEITHGTSLRRSHRHTSPVVTSSLLLKGLIVMIMVTIVTYIGYQVITAAGKPQLNVVFPRENQVVYTDEIELVGRAQPDSTVTIDGRQITVAEDGSFRHVLTLPEGRHSIHVKAENDLGRSSQVIRHFTIEAEAN